MPESSNASGTTTMAEEYYSAILQSAHRGGKLDRQVARLQGSQAPSTRAKRLLVTSVIESYPLMLRTAGAAARIKGSKLELTTHVHSFSPKDLSVYFVTEYENADFASASFNHVLANYKLGSDDQLESVFIQTVSDDEVDEGPKEPERVEDDDLEFDLVDKDEIEDLMAGMEGLSTEFK